MKMRGQHVVTLLLTVLTIADGGLLDGVFGVVELSPRNDTYIIVGRELVLNCSLAASYVGSLNASYLYFDYPSEHPRAAERVLNSRTRQLRIPDMQKSEAGTYICFLNKTLVGGKEKSLLSAAFASVHVGDLPVPVTKVSCVSDNFQSMTCKWCSAVMSSGLTTWRLEWSVGSSGWYYSCVSSRVSVKERCYCSNCSCTWPSIGADAFKPYKTYTLAIQTRSLFLKHDLERQFTIKTNESIVKPWPVEKLAVTSQNSTAIVISWKHPKRLDSDWFPLVYEVKHRDEGKEVVLETSNEMTVSLADLHPFTTYNISVRCRPVEGHHWSESKSVHGTTNEAEPSSPPIFLPGSFRVLPYMANLQNSYKARNVIIFWQPIPPKNQNGEIRGYEISCHSTEDSSLLLPPVNTTALSTTVTQLDARRSYVISVQAYNKVGRSPLAALYIPKSNNLLPPPGNVVAERGEDPTTITFSWDPVASPVSNYTLFWCQGRADITDACRGLLSHQIIPGDITQFEKVISKNKLERSYVYGLSVNTDAGSSGMARDWICVYDFDGLPGKPLFSFDPVMDAKSVSLSWEPVLCSTKMRGRVLNYTLELWKDDTKGRSTVRQLTLPPTATLYKFVGLTPYTNYIVKMAALARVCSSETYEKHICTLESAPDKPPESLAGYMKTNKLFVLRWHESPAPNGVITKYEVFAVVNETEVWRVPVNATRQSVTHDVDGGVTYSFSVLSVNKMGRSPPAKPLTLSTPVRAPGVIRADHLHMDVFNSTVARVQWSKPLHPNGPINNYITEVSLLDKDGTKINSIGNMTHPGNKTKMNISVKCHGQKVVTRVRVAAINRKGAANLVGRWSEAKNVTLCESPGGRFSMVVVIGIPTIVAFIIVLILIVYFIMKCYKKRTKPIPIDVPPRTRVVTSAESPQQDENDDTLNVPNNASNADDRTSLIRTISEESVFDETGGSSGDIPPYVQAGGTGPTRGVSSGSETEAEERPSVSVGDGQSGQAELVDEDDSSGSIPSYVKTANGRRGGASRCSSAEQHLAITNPYGYCTTTTNGLLSEPKGEAADINSNNPVDSSTVDSSAMSSDRMDSSAMPSDRMDSSAMSSDRMDSSAMSSDRMDSSAMSSDRMDSSAMSSDRMDSSAMSSDRMDSSAMSSSCGYCTTTIDELEPDGLAADIDVNRPVSYRPDLVATLPEVSGNTSEPDISESVV